MDKQVDDPLPIGRAAFAKAFCADWISEHSKKIVIAFATLILLSFLLFQVVGKFSFGSKPDYLKAQGAFSAWVLDDANDLKKFKSLEGPLRSHPELEAKFGTHVAQRLIGFGDVKKGGYYAKGALKRAHALISPYYERFSQTTLTIGQRNFPLALQEAISLKSDLEADDAFWQSRDELIRSGSVLYAYNLLRIAALQRELGSKEGELSAWEEFASHAGYRGMSLNKKMDDPEAYAFLAQNFTHGDISLPDFIEQRKKELTAR